jgi:hypothetical protein
VSKYIAIDLAPDGIFVVAGSARAGHVKIEQALSWTEADGAAPPTLAGDTAKRIGEQLRDKLKAAGVANAPVLVSVGRGRVILKELRYPVVPAAEEPALVKFQAMKELSDAADEMVLDYAPLSNGATDGERRSMAVVIRKELFAAIQQMCAAANLKLLAATPRPYAIAAGLTRAFAAGAVAAPESKADAVAALILGPAGGEFTVARGGEVTFTRDVPGPVATSEPMLLGEVRRNLTMYAGAAPGHPVQGLYVAEAAGGWAGRLRAALGLPVHAYDPLNGSVPDVPEPLRGRFAGAVGLLAAKSAGVLPINFAAPRQPTIEKDPKQKQLLFATLAVVVFLLVVSAYGFLTLSAAGNKLAMLQDEKSDLENQIKKLEPDAKRLDAATKWKARQVNWLDELFDTTDRFREASAKLGPKDKFFASRLDGHELAPDSKTGKQTSQAKMDIKIASSSLAPVNAFYEMVKGESKYYTGAKLNYGTTISGDASSKEYTIGVAGVKGRTPDQYTRSPAFAPPNRKYYPPSKSTTAIREDTPPKDTPDAEDEDER